MDTIETLKQDVREGRISAERLVDLVVDLSRKLEAANQRIEELEKQWRLADGEGRRTLLHCGRKKSDKKPAARKNARQAQGTTRSRLHRRQSGAGGANRSRFSRGCPAGRLSLVACSAGVAAGKRSSGAGRVPNLSRPGNRYGKIPGVLGRSEFGLEIVTEIAYLVYIVGLSFDKVCLSSISSRTCVCGNRKPTRCFISCRGIGKREFERALHVAGQLAGGACRRDALEPEQRLGVSFGEGPRGVVRRS